MGKLWYSESERSEPAGNLFSLPRGGHPGGRHWKLRGDRGRLWVKGSCGEITGPAGRQASLPTLSFRERAQRKEGDGKTENGARELAGPDETLEGLGLCARGTKGRSALTIADQLRSPLLRQPTYTLTKRLSHRPARAAPLPIGGPLANAAPHWRRAVVGGANRTKARPRARGAVHSQPKPGLIGQDHIMSTDWLSQRRAKPIPLVEKSRPILGSRGRGETGGRGRL